MSTKYHNIVTQVDGHKFDSIREANRYSELRLLLRAGEIANLELQPVYELHANDVKLGKYIADFRYIDVKTGKVVVEDSKGVRTAIYSWKKKHMKAEYGITIIEV